MLSNISILIVNSSHKSIDNLTRILKEKILSKQRPNIACLSHDEFSDVESLKNFFETFVSEKVTECQLAIENVRKINEFNQLEIWKNEMEKRSTVKRTRNLVENKLSILKHEKSFNIILDSPNDDDFYLILFDIYDCEVIKAIAKLETFLLMGLVNLHPRNDVGEAIKCETFWKKLLKLKHEKSFENFAFIDLDVPVESNYILNKRCQLIYDQFCHFFYDFQMLKLSYKFYYENLIYQDLGDFQVDNNDLKMLQKRLDEISNVILGVDDIYEAIVEQITQIDDSQTLDVKSTRQFMEMEAFGKRFYDMKDALRKIAAENAEFYSRKIYNLEKSCCDVWDNIETQQSVEQQQILNYFMHKVIKILDWNEKDHNSIVFYFTVLQFKNWQQVDNANKDFYENRSVGHKRMMNDKRQPKRTTSDACVEYRNSSSIPFEIEQLMNDEINFCDDEIFHIQFFSRSAMLQHMNDLKKCRKKYICQYSKIFDVLLVKFSSADVPEIFSSNFYRKTLATPLCFRDFNDYKKFDMADVKESSKSNKNFTNGKRQQEEKIFNNVDGQERKFYEDSFLLPSSIKFQQKASREEKSSETESSENARSESFNDNITMEYPIETVYNVCNKRMEFQIEESEFQSFPLVVKASIYTWLNNEKHLNMSCTLHDRVQFSYSYDIRNKSFNNATLCDEYTGMICSIDIGDVSEYNNMTLSFPHGMTVKVIDSDTVEMTFSHDDSTDKAETKRTYFSNGFVMIHMLNGTVKIYSPNGTIFDIGSKKRRSKAVKNEKLTEIYKFSLTSIHFLRNYLNISSYEMTLPSGNKFIVENDWIVEEMRSLNDVDEWYDDKKRHFHQMRDDDLKILYTDTYTKCLFENGTIVTKTYYLDDDDTLATAFDSNEMDNRKPISILDEIWLTEAENETKILMENVLGFVNEDYFTKVNHFCDFEHEKYGSVQFTKKGIEMKLFNGMTMTKRLDGFCISLNGIFFATNESKIEFYDEKCQECCSCNKISINIPTTIPKDYTSDNDECISEILITANDTENNIFEIRADGRQMFHEKWKNLICQGCKISRLENFVKKYGERWIVLNRDMSGYEIISGDPTESFNHINLCSKTWLETDDALLLCSHDDIYEINIDDNFLIDFEMYGNERTIDKSIKSSTSSQTLNKSLVKSSSRISQVNEIKEGMKRQYSNASEAILAETDDLKDTVSSRETVNDSSISSDIISGRQMIQFYTNPLLNLPKSISVSAYIKLHKNKLSDIIEALCHLRKYSREKFIINVDGLMKTPCEMLSIEEYFKFIVQSTIEEYIEDELELYRKSMARMMIEDLLEIAFERLFGNEGKNEIENDTDMAQDTEIDDLIRALTHKSFSFV